MLDDLASFNQDRWEALVRAGTEYSRPWLDLDPAGARRKVDRHGQLAGVDLEGRRVLCLAASGGQQSAAFALLGARVAVLDLCQGQLDRDLGTARHYDLEVEVAHGDMRDLSRYQADEFDLVWQAHSINFVPDPRVVFAQVARVIRPGGHYRVEITNPFVHGCWEDSWNGAGYVLKHPYQDAEVTSDDPHWDVQGADGETRRVVGPREFRHRVGTVVNGLVGEGFRLLGLWEDDRGDLAAEPGTWTHFKAFAAPWWTIWSVHGPGA